MRRARLLVMALAAALAATGALADIPTRTGLSMYIARMAATALPYDASSRWDAYLTISRIAEVLFHEDRYGADVASLETDTFTGYPHLVLSDKDGGAGADFFAYYETDAREFTREFGAFFTLGDDPRPAWLVFNNGTIIANMGDKSSEWEAFWATHQFVDRDGDGAFDLYIASGTDTDDDGRSGTEDTFWLYDDTGDGRYDRAETIVAGTARAEAPVDGVYHFGGEYGRDVGVDASLFAFADAIAADIVDALEEADR